MDKEDLRINNLAVNSHYAEGVNELSIKYSAKIFEKYIKAGSILEMGPAEGIMTELLASSYRDVTLVEGSKDFCMTLSKRFPKVKVINSLFENYIPDHTFNNIILGHILEHVINPVKILTRVKKWLTNDGRVLVAVPNANSLHRQLGVKMGMLYRSDSLSETDYLMGHRRVYTLEKLIEDFESAGLKVIKSGGYWIKNISNKQIDETYNQDFIQASMELGELYPEIAAEIYVIGTNNV